LLAIQCGLVSPGRGLVTLLPVLDTLKTLGLARLRGAFAFVGEPLAPIRELLACIGFALSLIGDHVASIRRRFAQPHATLSRLQLGLALCLAHLGLDLPPIGLGV
jgi:hypothetical protein